MRTKTREKLNMTPDQLKAEQKKEKQEKKAKEKQSGVLRDAMGRILPGYSGNNLGRPRTALSELCRKEVTKHGLVHVLGSIAARAGDYDKKTKIPLTVSDQINAIRLLLLYGYGMPKAELDSGDVKIEVTYADNRSVTIANPTPGTGANHQGVKEIQCTVVREEVRQDDPGPGSPDPSGLEG